MDAECSWEIANAIVLKSTDRLRSMVNASSTHHVELLFVISVTQHSRVSMVINGLVGSKLVCTITSCLDRLRRCVCVWMHKHKIVSLFPSILSNFAACWRCCVCVSCLGFVTDVAWLYVCKCCIYCVWRFALNLNWTIYIFIVAVGAAVEEKRKFYVRIRLATEYGESIKCRRKKKNGKLMHEDADVEANVHIVVVSIAIAAAAATN